MKQLSNFDKVLEFHKRFELEIDTPATPRLLQLRVDLMNEEFSEVVEEIFKGSYYEGNPDGSGFYYPDPESIDKAKLTKELCDLLYVIYGTGVALGLPLDLAFSEVHRSNMSKLGEDGRPVKRADGKALKGPNYTPADINQFFSQDELAKSKEATPE